MQLPGMEAPATEILIADEDEICGHIFYHKHSMLLKYFCLFCEKTYDNIHYYCEHLSEHVYETSQIDKDEDHIGNEYDASVENFKNVANQEISCQNECILNADYELNVDEDSNKFNGNFAADEDGMLCVKEEPTFHDMPTIYDNTKHVDAYTLEDYSTQDETHHWQHENEESAVIVSDPLITTMPIKEKAPAEGINISSMQFKCYTCKYNFPNLMCLKEHRCKNQSFGKNSIFHKCGDCNEVYNEIDGLNNHIRAVHHANEIICRFCGRSNFKSREALQEHMNAIHNNDEIFKCYICGRRYYLEANLLPHVWRHAKRVPQCCVVCGKVTLRIQHHMKFKHSPRPTRLLQCSICNKTFSYTSSLSRHKLLHKLPRTEISKTVRIDHTNAKQRRKKEKWNTFSLNAAEAAVKTQAAV